MLFKTSMQLKEFAQVSVVDFNSIKATIQMVEDNHIVPIISTELYNSLQTAYTTNENTLTDAQKKLLNKCRQVIGPWFCYYYAAKSDVALSDAGVRREESNTHKTAFQYQVTNFREANRNEAELQTEVLLQFLEDNKTDYPLWVGSANFIKHRGFFINTPAEFQNNFTTASPYRIYYAVANKMHDVEFLHVRKVLGSTLFNSLKEKLRTPSPSFTDKEKELIAILKKAIAASTIALSIPFLNVRIDESGLNFSAADSRSSNDKDARRSQATPQAIEAFRVQAADTARQWFEEAHSYLKENASDFNITPIETQSTQTKTFGLI